MQTVRRLYLYLLSGVTLAMLATGVVMALDVLFTQLGLGGTIIGGGPEADRQQLSAAAALVGVGLPVWAIHWFIAERGLRPSRPAAEAERASGIRALYLTLVLGTLLAFGIFAAMELLRAVVQRLSGAGAFSEFSDPAGSLALLLVTGAAWSFHVVIRRRDMRAGPVDGPAAWLPRLYLYAVAIVSLFFLLLAVGELMGYAASTLLARPAFGGEGFSRVALANQMAQIAVWSVVWIGHWWYAGQLAVDPGWRGMAERAAGLRVAYFVGVIGLAALRVLMLAAEAGRAVLVGALDAPDSGGGATGAILPLVSALPWLLAWWLHLRWLREEAIQRDDGGRAVTVERLEQHVVGIIGLGFAAIGTGWLLGLSIDVLLGGNRTIGDEGFWRAELATYVPLAIVGLLVWSWKWAQVQGRANAAAGTEAGSTARRTFLLIPLAAAILSGLGSLALILYRLFGAILGADISGNAVSELSTPIGALLVALAVAAYHGLLLRRDDALRATATPIAPAPAARPPDRRALVLSGPEGADLDATIAAWEAGLPPGYRLESS